DESPGDYGIGLAFHVRRDVAMEIGRAGATNLPRLLEMMAFSLEGYDAEWPSDKVQTKTIPLWRQRDTAPGSQATRAFRSALYGGHPYGMVATADVIAAVTSVEVDAWLRRTLVPRNAALVVVGDVDPAAVEAAARVSIGAWQESGEAVSPPPAVPLPVRAGALTPAALPALAQPLVTHRPGAT